jgi:hypothetical protein
MNSFDYNPVQSGFDHIPFVNSEFCIQSSTFINVYAQNIILEIGSGDGSITSFLSDNYLHNQNSCLHYINANGNIYREFLHTISKTRNLFKIRFFTLRPSTFFDRYKTICFRRYTLIYFNIDSYLNNNPNNQEIIFQDLQHAYSLLQLHGILWITNSENIHVQKFLSVFIYYFEIVHYKKEIGLKRTEQK